MDWFRDSAALDCLQAVAGAVWAGRRVAMRYESWSKTSDRAVEPLGLVLKAGVKYLAARTPGRVEPLAYRLSAVLSLQVLDETFSTPPDFDLAAWWRRSTARFEAGVYTASARLRVTEEGYMRLCRLSPSLAAAAQDSVAPCEPEGWAEVLVPIESVHHATQEMLRLGDQAVVLEPAALRDALQSIASRMAAGYAAQA